MRLRQMVPDQISGMNNDVRWQDFVRGQCVGAVVEGGSFVKAAELIGLTDSGVSRPSTGWRRGLA
jgi:hypothetical protein